MTTRDDSPEPLFDAERIAWLARREREIEESVRRFKRNLAASRRRNRNRRNRAR